MKRNMSNVDRLVRVLITAVLFYLYFAGVISGTLGVILVVVGAIFLATSIISFCPIYGIFKLSTYKK